MSKVNDDGNISSRRLFYDIKFLQNNKNKEKHLAGNFSAFRSFEKIEMYNQNRTLYNHIYRNVQYAHKKRHEKSCL